MNADNLTVVRNEPQPCQVRLDIQVDSQEVDRLYKDVAREVARQARVPGFRPGKAPRGLIRSRFGKEIDARVMNRLVDEGVRQALAKEELDPETSPRVENEERLEVKPGEAFVFSVQFDLPPEFELPDYRDIELDVGDSQVDEDAVQRVIDGWLEQRATYDKVDRPAAPGDLLKVTYEGTLEDNAEEDIPDTARFVLKAEDTWLALRDPEILPGCTAALEGVEAGDERTMHVEFPQTFFEESLRGKSADYTVRVHEVHAAEIPALTDDLAQEIGAEDVGEVRRTVRMRLESEESMRQEQEAQQDAVNKVLEGMDFPLPPGLMARETYETLMQLVENRSRSGQSQEELGQHQEELMNEARQQAEQRLRRRYVLGRIADEENIQVDKEEFEETLQAFSRYHQMSPKALRRRLTENGRISDLLWNIREQKVIRRLVEIARESGDETAEAEKE